MPLQIRRGTDAQRQGITPALGEPIFVTDTNKLYIGDGTTVGGNLISGGSSSSVAWGDITGTLSLQTDLASALSGKADTGHTHSNVTESTSGFMSASDKIKLNGIATGATANTGTVTSVGLSLPTALFTNPASPINTSGTLTVTFNAVTANTILAGPTTGSAAAPTMRALVAADLPTHTHTASDIISGLSLVATSGNYTDLTGTPVLGSAAYVDSTTFANASHSHGASDITSGTFDITRIPTGSTNTTVCIGNDSRLSDERTPINNTVSTDKIQNNAVVADKIADAAVTMAKIAQAGATTNQVIKWNGSAWAPADDETTTGSAGAPSDAEYLVKSSNGGLSAERVVTDSTSITADWTTAGQVQLKRAALTGDVTADANSNTTAIANGAVTYAKIQDVSATDKILGRSSAGTGDIEEITCTAAGRALLDDANAADQRTTLGLGGAAEKAVDFYVASSSVSTFGASLIDDATAADARTTLGLGSAATLASTAFADADHEHDATDITSGTLSIDRIPTGTTNTTVCIGNDARLSDNRDPNSHIHGNISNDGKISSTAGLVVKTGEDGIVTTLGMGTAGQVLKVNSTATDIEWGTDNTSGGGGDVATDDIWTAKGELAVGTGDNTAQALSAGTNGQYLVAASGETTGLKWQSLAVGTTAGLPVVTTTSGVLTTLSLGTSGQQLRVDDGDPASLEWFTPSTLAHTHGLTDSYIGQIETASNKTYTIDGYVPLARTITDIRIQSSGGTCTAIIKNGANTVGTVSVSNTSANSSPSLNNTTVNTNGTITLEISNNDNAVNVWFAVRYVAVTGAIT